MNNGYQYAQCQNCHRFMPFTAQDIYSIESLVERVAPGEPMPARECPECKCLAHPVSFEDIFFSLIDRATGEVEDDYMESTVRRWMADNSSHFYNATSPTAGANQIRDAFNSQVARPVFEAIRDMKRELNTHGEVIDE